MHNNKIILLALTLFSISPCLGEEKRLMTREEVVRLLLPRSIEANTPREIEGYWILRNAKELAYPALAEELMETTDPMLVDGIATIFTQSEGDKTIPLEALTSYLKKRIGDESSKGGVGLVIMALGQIGGEKEAAVLREFLDVEDILLRHSIEANLGYIEKRVENQKRQAAMKEKRPKKPMSNTANESINAASSTEKNGGKEDSSTSQVSHKPWLIGAIVLLLASVFLIFKKRFAR